MKQQQTQTRHQSVCQAGRKKTILSEQCSSTLSIHSKISEKRQQERQKYNQSQHCPQDRILCHHNTLKGQQFVSLFKKLKTRRLNKSFVELYNYTQSSIASANLSVFGKIVSQSHQIQGHPEMQTNTNKSTILHNFHDYNTSSVKSNIFPKQSKSQDMIKTYHKQLFKITLQNNRYEAKIKSLQSQLEQVLRRQQKEVAKKKSSLEGLVLELSQKGQRIQQQQIVIRCLESKLKARDNGTSHLILEQDCESLRRVVFRLENINDKLNNDLLRSQKQQQSIEARNQDLISQNHRLKLEIRQLKEELFEYQHLHSQAQANKRQLQIMTKKLSNKMRRIKIFDMKINDIQKQRGISTSDIVQILSFKSDIKMAQTASTVLQRSQQVRQFQIQEKIESIFTFLFNIQDHNYELHQSRLFDTEQKQLLVSHKQKYLTNLKFAKQNSPKPTNKIRNDISSIHNPFDLSILQIFQQNDKDQHSQTKDKVIKLNMKLIDLQRQKNKSIDKISDLKKKQLHIRSLILIFLKSLELKSLRKQCESILQIIFDFYQYSQDQKLSIFQQAKPKKFFGLI